MFFCGKQIPAEKGVFLPAVFIRITERGAVLVIGMDFACRCNIFAVHHVGDPCQVLFLDRRDVVEKIAQLIGFCLCGVFAVFFNAELFLSLQILE